MGVATRRRSRRARWLVVCATLLPLSCHSARPLSRESLRLGELPPQGHLRLTYEEGRVLLEPGWKLDYPWVSGKEEVVRGTPSRELVEGEKWSYRYNLEDATKIELRELDKRRSWALGLGAGAAGAAVLYALFAAIAAAAALSAMSCPVVLVTDVPAETQVVGEIWPGATGPSLAREDWLALPTPPGASRVRVAIVNRHAEIQHLAGVELAFASHEPSNRAVATPSGPPVVIAETWPPREATVRGASVLGVVARADGRYWQSGQEEIRLGGTEAVEAVFEAAGGGDRAVLIRFENTLFHGASLALRLDEACGSPATASPTSIRPDCGRWRLREGFDSLVTVTDSVGSHIFELGSAGVEMGRTVALPIGEAVGPVRVRIEAGSGFLRLDSVELAHVVERTPPIGRFGSVATRGGRAGSEVEAGFERSIVLAAAGERLDLDFRPGARTVAGTWFLVGTGYYELQPAAARRLAAFREVYRTALGSASAARRR